MTISQLTHEQVDQLAGETLPAGITLATNGMQPYYHWLMQTIHRLAQTTFTNLRVDQASESATSIHVSAGRATIDSVVLESDALVIDLSSYNNDTAYIWIEDDSGEALIDSASDATGWPGAVHIKLAEVTLTAGEITAIVDRRLDHIFTA